MALDPPVSETKSRFKAQLSTSSPKSSNPNRWESRSQSSKASSQRGSRRTCLWETCMLSSLNTVLGLWTWSILIWMQTRVRNLERRRRGLIRLLISKIRTSWEWCDSKVKLRRQRIKQCLRSERDREEGISRRGTIFLKTSCPSFQTGVCSAKTWLTMSSPAYSVPKAWTGANWIRA